MAAILAQPQCVSISYDQYMPDNELVTPEAWVFSNMILTKLVGWTLGSHTKRNKNRYDYTHTKMSAELFGKITV